MPFRTLCVSTSRRFHTVHEIGDDGDCGVEAKNRVFRSGLDGVAGDAQSKLAIANHHAGVAVFLRYDFALLPFKIPQHHAVAVFQVVERHQRHFRILVGAGEYPSEVCDSVLPLCPDQERP